MKITKALGIILLLVMLFASAGQCWEFIEDDEGWCDGFTSNLTCGWLGPPHGWGGHLWLQPTGLDPYQVGPIGYEDKMLSAKACRYISLSMLVGSTTDTISEFYWRKGSTWYGRQFTLTNTDATQWVTYNFNMTQSPDWSGDIAQIRLDPISPGHAGASILYDYVRPMYLLDGSAYWGFDSDTEGWYVSGNISSYRADGGYLKGTSNTADPHIYNYPGPTIDASHNNCIRVRMKTSAGTTAEFYWEPWASGYRSFAITSDNTFREYVLNMASTASWTSMTSYLRFDPSNANGSSFEIDYIQVFRDKTPPTGSVKINNDATYTTGTSATLNLSASDPDIGQDHPVKKGSGVWQARYRNLGGSWGSWEAYSTTKAWTLTSGDGTKTVEVQYRDVAENISSIYTDSIILDNTAPNNPSSASEAGGAANNTWQKNVSSPVFTWSGASDATSGVKGYYWYFGTSSSGNPATWTTSAGCSPGVQSSGTYYLRVKTEDKAGNQSGVSTLFTFKYDGTSPSTPVVTDDGDYITSTTKIHASWSAADAESGIAEYQYAISTSQSEAGIISGGGWLGVGTAQEATRTDLSLNLGTTYYVLVKAKNGVGLWSAIGVSDGVTVCETPSITNHPVSQTKFEGESVTFSVVATGTTPLSYQWRKGGTVISGADSANYNISSAVIADSGSYDCVVTNACGSITSDAAILTVNALVIQPIGEAKKSADGVSVTISGKVTAIFTGYFYVQDDSTAGIRVAPAVMPEGLELGNAVTVVGVLSTTSDLERSVVPSYLDVSTGSEIVPVLFTNKGLGGGDFFYDSDTGAGQKGVEDGVGVNNIGLLVKTCGTVTSVGEDHFYIDDGTHAKDFSVFNGIRVRCEGLTLPSSGEYICVSGISSIMKVNERVFRSIKPRSNGDIQLTGP